ncbi:hypothetical protein [Streptomyces platensis]|uniref:hypothetical protein n=1 Tax=Streptomyces platensis TaxID=58346 RepID=UPI0037B1B4AE
MRPGAGLGCGDGLLLELLAARPANAPSLLAGLDLFVEELASDRRRPGLAEAELRAAGRRNSPSVANGSHGCVSSRGADAEL